MLWPISSWADLAEITRLTNRKLEELRGPSVFTHIFHPHLLSPVLKNVCVLQTSSVGESC